MPKLRNQSIVSAATANGNGVATSQSLAAAGPLVLNGTLVSTLVKLGVSFLSANLLNSNAYAQPLTITSSGNDSTLVWTITGTDYGGSPVSEQLAGANAGTATSANLYATITSIVGSKATAGTVTAGTGATQYGPWLIVGAQKNEFQTNVRSFIGTTAVPSSATYSIQATSDINLMNQLGGYADDIDVLETNITTNVSSYPNATWMGYRLVVSTGGPVNLRVLQNRTA